MHQPAAVTNHHSASERILFYKDFTELEELIDCAKEWDLQFMQLERGQFQGNLTQVITSEWHLSHAKFGSSLKQEGLPPRHLRNIVIPATRSQEFSWRGQRITGNSMMLFPLGAELESISARDFEVYIIAIQEEHLDQACRILGLKSLEELIDGAEVLQCEPHAIQHLRHTMGHMMQQARLTPETIMQASFSRQVEVDLCSQVLSVLQCGQAAEPEGCPRRQHYILRKAEAHIKVNAHEGPTIHQICRDLNISERTLRAAFQARYGISPKVYLKCYQLTQVRRQLYRQHSAGNARVIDIANRWGFWHMGQFARDYKEMFGELPSDTLLRKYPSKGRQA
jgi:AraC family ethanolamine operon transcriptional activator